MRTKQVIVIRRDLKMRRGKEIAQGAHASMLWLRERVKLFDEPDKLPRDGSVPFSEAEKAWLKGDYKKVVVTVNSEKHLRELHEQARRLCIQSHLVTDLGLTEFEGVPTVTALAIGPATDEIFERITDGLPLY